MERMRRIMERKGVLGFASATRTIQFYLQPPFAGETTTQTTLELSCFVQFFPPFALQRDALAIIGTNLLYFP